MSLLTTQFASPERADPARVLQQSQCFSEQLLFRDLLDRVPDMVLVLNSDRQIVYANRAVLQAFHSGAVADIAGQRLGELFHCKHASENAAGCGTTRFCWFCGAVNSILQAQNGDFAVEECRLLVDTAAGEEALDLRVWASPLAVAGEPLTFLVVANIADEKRRLWLEKIFLHDLMNTATALRGFSWLLRSDASAHPDDECTQSIAALTERIIDEIESHRQLVAAENNELRPEFTSVRSRQVLEQVYAAYNSPDLLNGRALRIAPDAQAFEMETDRTLLVRVVGNMVKNALESSVPHETVTLGCRCESDAVVFWVHNPTYIPENVRLQIFNRSFSTKGRGRGLGTYSMKLLSERYLRGHVTFSSSESDGTRFLATYPRLARSS